MRLGLLTSNHAGQSECLEAVLNVIGQHDLTSSGDVIPLETRQPTQTLARWVGRSVVYGV